MAKYFCGRQRSSFGGEERPEDEIASNEQELA